VGRKLALVTLTSETKNFGGGVIFCCT